MKTQSVHIARNGQPLGLFEADKVADHLEMGQLRSDDIYYDETKAEWVYLSEWTRPGKSHGEFRSEREPRQTTSADSSTAERRSSGGSRSRSRHGGAMVWGWLACLFALAVAAAALFWSRSISDSLDAANARIAILLADKDTLQKESQALREVTPPNYVRTLVTYQPSDGQVSVASGVSVLLRKREEVAQALGMVAGKSDLDLSTAIDKLNLLPAPLAITITDSNGRASLALPGPGEYVLVVVYARTGLDGTSLRSLWLPAVEASNQASPVIQLDDRNANTADKTGVSLTEIRSFVSGN